MYLHIIVCTYASSIVGTHEEIRTRYTLVLARSKVIYEYIIYVEECAYKYM